MIIIAWIIFYFVASFFPVLGWGVCDHEWNSDGTYVSLQCVVCVCECEVFVVRLPPIVKSIVILFKWLNPRDCRSQQILILLVNCMRSCLPQDLSDEQIPFDIKVNVFMERFWDVPFPCTNPLNSHIWWFELILFIIFVVKSDLLIVKSTILRHRVDIIGTFYIFFVCYEFIAVNKTIKYLRICQIQPSLRSVPFHLHSTNMCKRLKKRIHVHIKAAESMSTVRGFCSPSVRSHVFASLLPQRA